MPTTALNISVINKRMLSEAEAADYCGLPRKHFKSACTVTPIAMAAKAVRYDRHDLDQWIEGLKADDDTSSRDDILGRLG